MLRLIFLLLVALPLLGKAEIVETAKFQDAISFIDADTWVLVDLDNTFFEGKQALGHTEWFYDKAHVLMADGMTLEEATRVCYPEWIEVQKVCPVKPVEEAFIPALRELQNKGIVVMGLTHRQPCIADSTLKQVKSLAFNFSDAAPVKYTLSVPSDTPTLFDEGVLFTGEFNKKGDIFVKFLGMINQRPKKVMMIDDKLSHVKDVEQAMQGLGIPYIGVYYRAFEHVEKIYFPEVAEFQYKFVKKILSNEAARFLMENDLE